VEYPWASLEVRLQEFYQQQLREERRNMPLLDRIIRPESRLGVFLSIVCLFVFYYGDFWKQGKSI